MGALKPPAFFAEDLPIRPRSKLSRRIIPPLALGFCRGTPVKVMASGLKISEKVTRELIYRMRALLLDPRYRRWHSFDLESVLMIPNAAAIEAELWACYSSCYFNEECYRNYHYRKREQRRCSVCPARRSEQLKGVLSDELEETMLSLVDTVRAQYLALLGLSKEKITDQSDNFRQRAIHTMVILHARMASSTNDDGALRIDPALDGPGTIPDLWRTLLGHIEERSQL